MNIAEVSRKHLAWFPEIGMGYFPVTAAPYDDGYWKRYLLMDSTPVGEQLTRDRCAWVRRFWPGGVCDVGIGGGRFVRELSAFGFDVNPHAVDWLKAQGRWLDPYRQPVDAITCWDSLEHIEDPTPLLANVRGWVFTSLPIFDGPDHVLRSKHYRRDEHFLYFTRAGLVRFMQGHGFECVSECDMEQHAGREDILTYAFHRNGAATAPA